MRNLFSLHVSTNEVKPLLSEGIVSLLGMTSYRVTHMAVNISHTRHYVGVTIPQGAVLPSEGRIDIEFGVGMHGRFNVSDGISVRRVSPICTAVHQATRLWWISQGYVYFTFSPLNMRILAQGF